ncbi:MAG: hypothetical protein ABIU54_05655 [Candidatus Eisenbacteria bacterium]
MLESLEASVHRLERRITRLTAIASVLALGFVLSILWQLLPKPTLDAQRFMLRDNIGIWRGALMMREDGCPVVRLNDSRGKARLYGVVLPDGNARLRFTDSTGIHRAILELEQHSLPQLSLLDQDGRLRARVAVDSAGHPTAELIWGGQRRMVSLEPAPEASH